MPEHLIIFIIVGFAAQMIDGILGMAYGVSATTFLLAFGVSPAIASASTHAAEVVTTGFSAASHFGFGNVNRRLVKALLIPGIIGAVLGAYILVTVPGDRMKPFTAAYLLVMGVIILSKAWQKREHREVHTHIIPLGFAGGFCDAIGGGGWGPIVTGTLLARGNEPRETIGSVNFAEFFVTVAASATFFVTIGFSQWTAIAGLAIGGAIAAPIAAWAVRRIPARPMLAVVGVLVILLSLRTIYLALR
ncbi:MAG: sulfite exporter TauE/SafE family protein [Thermoanaerobaculia bacterium]